MITVRMSYIFFSEMKPQWYSIDAVPYKKMWPDDDLWFPYLLKEQSFYGYFLFEGMDTIVNYHLAPVNNLSEITIPKQPQTTCR